MDILRQRPLLPPEVAAPVLNQKPQTLAQWRHRGVGPSLRQGRHDLMGLSSVRSFGTSSTGKLTLVPARRHLNAKRPSREARAFGVSMGGVLGGTAAQSL